MLIKNKKINITTLGCRVNLYESNAIIDQLVNRGAVIVDEVANADICIINTCCVTSKADRKSRNMISRAIKNKHTQLVIVVGCFSQNSINDLTDHKIGIILGTKYKSVLGTILDTYQEGDRIVQIEPFSKHDFFETFEQEVFYENTRAFIKIQDGCDQMCSYCIIPFVRGRQRSLEHTRILTLVEQLVNNDYKEIILTGVNTAGYYDKDYSFTNLLKDINQIQGDFRVRISSLEPFQINHEIIDLITSNPKRWCQHLHICLQAGSNEVIKVMNRKYTIETFMDLCKYIRSKNKEMAITTDYIVGFPTETKAMHDISIKNLRLLKFADMHIFPYSSRTNTAAAKLKSQLTDQEKQMRVDEISKINVEMSEQYLLGFINKTVNVLFEKPKQLNLQSGHSEFNFKVNVPTTKHVVNQLLKVKIDKLVSGQLVGHLI